MFLVENNLWLLLRDDLFAVGGNFLVKYVKDLLDYSIAKLTNKEGATSSNVPVQRPHLTSPSPFLPLTEGDRRRGETFSRLWWEGVRRGVNITINKSPFPTGSCIDRCHVNYVAYRTIYQKEIFRHKMHSLINAWNVINVTIMIN